MIGKIMAIFTIFLRLRFTLLIVSLANLSLLLNLLKFKFVVSSSIIFFMEALHDNIGDNELSKNHLWIMRLLIVENSLYISDFNPHFRKICR